MNELKNRTQDEFKRQQLDILQGIISRMASNSFQIKGFTIAMATILGAIYERGVGSHHIWTILLVVTICCTLMDAYYLQLERKYRKLYEESIKRLDQDRPLSELYDMSLKGIKKSYLSCLCSQSLIMPYGLLLAIILIASIIGHLPQCS